MSERMDVDYNRIAQAIDYITNNAKQQPSLSEVASAINLSPHHVQKLFTQWAGISPKKFIQYLSISHARQLLRNDHLSLLETAHLTGLSGTGRLHDLFIRIESMTPGEFKSGGSSLCINYSFAASPFGRIIIASTSRGICYMAFEESEHKAFDDLIGLFPRANYCLKADESQKNALLALNTRLSKANPLRLHIKGSAFQIKVWEALLKIPAGRLSSYGKIAQTIGQPKSARAVGTAIGRNPVAFLIPCHRVIQASGNIGGYMWGGTRKSAMIGWEASIHHQEK